MISPPLLLFTRRLGPLAGLLSGLEANGIPTLLAEDPAIARELIHRHGIKRLVVDLLPPLDAYGPFMTWIRIRRPAPAVLLLCSRYEETVLAGMGPRRKAWAAIRPVRLADLAAFAQRDPPANGPFTLLTRLSWAG